MAAPGDTITRGDTKTQNMTKRVFKKSWSLKIKYNNILMALCVMETIWIYQKN